MTGIELLLLLRLFKILEEFRFIFIDFIDLVSKDLFFFFCFLLWLFIVFFRGFNFVGSKGL